MKKIAMIAVTALLMFCLTSCGSEEEVDLSDQVITRSDAEEETSNVSATEEPNPEGVADEVFSFQADGVTLTPGTPFDPTVLPDAENIYTVPSCAVEGTDNVYSYSSFEVTAYDDGEGEVIYSVYLTDPNRTTTEGLAMGDEAGRVTALYGEDYAEDGTSMIYTRGNTQLIVILQEETVVSIEYLLVL